MHSRRSVIRLTRRQVLAAAPAAGFASAAGALAPADDERAFDAQQWLVVHQLFERLRQAPSRWELDDLLHDNVTFMDLNRAASGEVTGRAKTVERLR
jgi:hypothetical protein